MTLRPRTRLIRSISAALSAALLGACAANAPAAQESQLTSAEQDAVRVARSALPAEASAAGEPVLRSVEPRQWPDSSLGCPQPGLSYLHVITPGYVVKFSAGGREHEVRVAGETAVTCTQAVSGVARRPASTNRVTNLDVMEKQAAADLAMRLGVEVEQIRIQGRIAQRWQDESLGCTAAATQPATRGAVAGFKILLEHAGRRYTYHTDLKRVMACPPIDAQ